jgi:hypothetical protein
MPAVRLPLLMLVLASGLLVSQGCDPSSSSSSAPQNVQPIVVNAGPTTTAFDEPFTAVTVCVPGTTNCETIDGILVDTGSSGLRVVGSLLTIPLPQQTVNGAAITECAQFVDGSSWGAVVTADIQIGTERANGVPIQAIGTTVSPTVPAACTASGPLENTVAALGANGILGVGLFRQDCGFGCTVSTAPGLYYGCTSSGCLPTTEALALQLQNPVWLFPKDNNGVILDLPTVPAAGQLSATGSLIFGIGTQSNNAIGSAKVLGVDANGYLATAFGTQAYGGSYIDSGSNGIFFLDAKTTGIPVCADATDFFCPLTLQSATATIGGTNGVTAAAPFTVANFDQLNGSFSAFNNVGGPNPGQFDWGLPFFFGRRIFTAIELQSTPSGVGPYFAY